MVITSKVIQVSKEEKVEDHDHIAFEFSDPSARLAWIRYTHTHTHTKQI